jgi:hypothetical protein
VQALDLVRASASFATFVGTQIRSLQCRIFVRFHCVLSSAIVASNSRTATIVSVVRIAHIFQCERNSVIALSKKLAFCIAPRDDTSLR